MVRKTVLRYRVIQSNTADGIHIIAMATLIPAAAKVSAYIPPVYVPHGVSLERFLQLLTTRASCGQAISHPHEQYQQAATVLEIVRQIQRRQLGPASAAPRSQSHPSMSQAMQRYLVDDEEPVTARLAASAWDR
jgi:hypothetical protein